MQSNGDERRKETTAQKLGKYYKAQYKKGKTHDLLFAIISLVSLSSHFRNNELEHMSTLKI